MSSAGYSKVNWKLHFMGIKHDARHFLGRRLLWPASLAFGWTCLQPERRPATQCAHRSHRNHSRTGSSAAARPFWASLAPAELPRRHCNRHLQTRRRQSGSPYGYASSSRYSEDFLDFALTTRFLGICLLPENLSFEVYAKVN